MLKHAEVKFGLPWWVSRHNTTLQKEDESRASIVENNKRLRVPTVGYADGHKALPLPRGRCVSPCAILQLFNRDALVFGGHETGLTIIIAWTNGNLPVEFVGLKTSSA